ncbi:MAG: hypothetical protein WB500_03675 [Rhodoplanes sp.]
MVFSQTPVETLKVLPDNGRLFVRAFDFQGAGKDASFDLGTASEVREKIRVTCRWPAPKPAAKASSPVAGSAPGKP